MVRCASCGRTITTGNMARVKGKKGYFCFKCVGVDGRKVKNGQEIRKNEIPAFLKKGAILPRALQYKRQRELMKKGLTKKEAKKQAAEESWAKQKAIAKAIPIPQVQAVLAGVEAVEKNAKKRWKKGSQVQSIAFLKKKWTIAKAKKWLRSHGFKAPKVDSMKTEFRFRQISPKKMIKGHFRSIPFGRGLGIRAIIAEPVKNPKKGKKKGKRENPALKAIPKGKLPKGWDIIKIGIKDEWINYEKELESRYIPKEVIGGLKYGGYTERKYFLVDIYPSNDSSYYVVTLVYHDFGKAKIKKKVRVKSLAKIDETAIQLMRDVNAGKYSGKRGNPTKLIQEYQKLKKIPAKRRTPKQRKRMEKLLMEIAKEPFVEQWGKQGNPTIPKSEVNTIIKEWGITNNIQKENLKKGIGLINQGYSFLAYDYFTIIPNGKSIWEYIVKKYAQKGDKQGNPYTLDTLLKGYTLAEVENLLREGLISQNLFDKYHDAWSKGAFRFSRKNPTIKTSVRKTKKGWHWVVKHGTKIHDHGYERLKRDAEKLVKHHVVDVVEEGLNPTSKYMYRPKKPKKGSPKKCSTKKGKKKNPKSAWVKFLKKHGGKGHTRKQLQKMYHKQGKPKKKKSKKRSKTKKKQKRRNQ